MLFHISYISRSTNQMDESSLNELELEASSKNKATGVTGFLVYDGSHFFQYIEGEQDVIESLFRRIEKDKRHMSVTELSSGPIDERILGEWSMKCFMPADFVAEDRVHFLDLLSAKHEKETIPEIVASLQFTGA